MSYKVKLEVFEGPLDLLLYLIKKNELDIYNIPIAQITEQYAEYLDIMQLLDLNIAGEFLVMASTLMQIKSRMLLPKEEMPEEEEPDPRAELVRRLLEYKRFKQAANFLEDKEHKRSQVFTRTAGHEDIAEPEEETYFEASIFDLISAFNKVLKDTPRQDFIEIVKDEFTVEEKIHSFLHLLAKRSRIRFSKLFRGNYNRFEIVTTFLALLELIRLHEIVVRQDRAFGEIYIFRAGEHIKPQVE
jgi:segregation and condensation protein A